MRPSPRKYARHVRDCADIIHGPEYVGYVSHGDKFRARRHQRIEIIEVEQVVGASRMPEFRGDAVPFEPDPGTDVGLVIGRRHDDLVARNELAGH